jgi:ribosomal-protein-alanine N-acetyltransferase
MLLRRFRAEDVEDAFEYRNDPEFVKFLPHIPHPFSRDDAVNFVALNMTEDWQTSPTFAIVFGDKLIGTVNFEIDAASRSAMVGYAIGRRWWGWGLATEAVTLAIAWAREEFALQRIWASTDCRNERSQRVLTKLGFKCEDVRVAERPDRDGVSVEEAVFGLDFSPPPQPRNAGPVAR